MFHYEIYNNMQHHNIRTNICDVLRRNDKTYTFTAAKTQNFSRRQLGKILVSEMCAVFIAA
jgi:hypothetical protein